MPGGHGNRSNRTMPKTKSTKFNSTTAHALQATHHFKRDVESNKFEPTFE